MTRHKLNTVIIGGGQAGLSLSYYLTQKDREHAVLEKDRPAESWRSRKWDSFTLVTPNRQMQLPDFEYKGEHPEGFMPRDKVVEYIDNFTSQFDPPLHLGVEAKTVEEQDGGFYIDTSAGELQADNVVVATGTFQKPKIPAYSQNISPDVNQLHSSQYRNPDRLPPGAVLVVGSGQSGCQIAEELYQSGRDVYLSTGKAVRVPRRYRGKDFTWWLLKLGALERTVDDLPSPEERFHANPQVSGKSGGHSLNLHQFAQDGVTLLGRLKHANGSKLEFADDLHQNLQVGDNFEAGLTQNINKYVEKSGMDAPKEELPELRNGYDSETITELDLDAANISTIIWAMGYRFDFGLVKFPIFDEFGYPKQTRGVTEQPGLYFLGLHWLHTIKSGLFAGIADDAAHVAEHI